MEIISSFASDTGRKRKANEDSVLSNDWLGLYLVADGMGGHSCGDVASQTALEVARGKVELAKKNGNLDKDPCKVLLESIELANRAVFELAQGMPNCRSMGTTVTGLVLNGDKLFTGNVGDSRVYRIRDSAMEQLTRDHSLVEEQIALGTITKEQARTSPVRNVITRALGLKETVEVDLTEHDIRDGDFILACSDGLTGMVPDEEILATVLERGSENLNAATTELIELANLNGGTDNITVILLYMRP